jgi:hypothetical protein
MAAQNVKNPASYYHAVYRHQMERQRSSSCLSLREQRMRAVTRFIQPTGSAAIIPFNIANSCAYYNYLNMAHPNGARLYRQLPVLPAIVPAVTDASSSTAYSARYSNGTNSALNLPTRRQSPVAPSSQSTPLPSGSGQSALPEQQGFQVDISRVSNSPIH